VKETSQQLASPLALPCLSSTLSKRAKRETRRKAREWRLRDLRKGGGIHCELHRNSVWGTCASTVRWNVLYRLHLIPSISGLPGSFSLPLYFILKIIRGLDSFFFSSSYCYSFKALRVFVEMSHTPAITSSNGPISKGLDSMV
jgi:hypothetical protein